jgi:hypothetical protein
MFAFRFYITGLLNSFKLSNVVGGVYYVIPSDDDRQRTEQV